MRTWTGYSARATYDARNATVRFSSVVRPTGQMGLALTTFNAVSGALSVIDSASKKQCKPNRVTSPSYHRMRNRRKRDVSLKWTLSHEAGEQIAEEIADGGDTEADNEHVDAAAENAAAGEEAAGGADGEVGGHGKDK